MPRPPFPAHRLFRVACVLAALGALPVFAELAWDALEVATKVRADQAEAIAVFAFANSGPDPVTITSVHPGCGCTVPALAKNTYAPGERGEIRLAYHPGNREGEHRVDIEVTTDNTPEYTLTLVADIEALVAFDTRFVFWKGSEPRTPKHIRLTFAEGQGATLVGTQSSDPRFTIAFRPVGDSGREYDIEVTPPPPAVLNYTAITLKTLVGSAKVARDFTVVARTL